MSDGRGLVIGNWKMNLDVVEAVHLTQQLTVLAKHEEFAHVDVVLAPPFVDLRSVGSVLEAERPGFTLGAQHVNPHESGAHTGEVSLPMLTRLGVQWVIVGHSERRAHYGMDDATVALTLATVAAGGVTGVLCVGETLDERELGRFPDVVTAQLDSALAALPDAHRHRVVVAYEPLWAIGTGVTASTDQVAEATASIRETLAGLGYGATRVLYGGSVTAESAAGLIAAGPDGFLVGGASLKAETFAAIVRATNDWYAGLR